jgi:hypothetical protein
MYSHARCSICLASNKIQSVPFATPLMVFIFYFVFPGISQLFKTAYMKIHTNYSNFKVCGGCRRPWFMARPSTEVLRLQNRGTLWTVPVYVQTAMYAVIKQCCPNCCGDPDSGCISKNFLKSLDAPAFSLPRHNLSRQLPSKLPVDLLSALLVWVWRGSVVPNLCPLYNSPYTALRRDPCLHSPGRAAGGDHRRELPQGVHGCGHHAWQPTTLSRPPGPGATATPAVTHPGGPAATKWVLFLDPLVSPSSQ